MIQKRSLKLSGQDMNLSFDLDFIFDSDRWADKCFTNSISNNNLYHLIIIYV